LEPGGLIPEGIQFITFDPTDNSIIVRGTDEEIRQLQEAISFFDVAPKQVQIKVEFITTSRSIARALGFDWLYSRGGVFLGVQPGSFASAGDPIFFNWASGNVTTRLRALLQEGQGKVVNAPVLRTLNNQAASVQQGVQTWIFLNQVIAIGNGNVITQSIPVPVSVQTVLNVRPRINNDGTISMTLNPSISDLGQIRRGPDGSEVPDILFQNIGIATRVKNGETIALAGMTRKSETGSQARFPILGDLPIIGQFFRSTRKEVNNTELLIFVTPTIIEDDSIGGIGP
jgi:general secretion pathway protein D